MKKTRIPIQPSQIYIWNNLVKANYRFHYLYQVIDLYVYEDKYV